MKIIIKILSISAILGISWFNIALLVPFSGSDLTLYALGQTPTVEELAAEMAKKAGLTKQADGSYCSCSNSPASGTEISLGSYSYADRVAKSTTTTEIYRTSTSSTSVTFGFSPSTKSFTIGANFSTTGGELVGIKTDCSSWGSYCGQNGPTFKYI